MRTLLLEDARKANLPRYGAAVLSVALAFAIHFLIANLTPTTSLALFFVAVAFSAWYGGLGPGLLATFLSGLISLYFFLPPEFSFNLRDPDTFISLALFVVSALLINVLSYARTLAETRVNDERARLQGTLASIGDAVITTDTEGRVTFMNPVAESLTGWRQAEAQGRDLQEIFNIVNETTRAPAENPVSRVLRWGAIAGLANHTIIIARDGSERPIDDSAAPIRDEAGNVLGVVMVFRDITERKRAEDELRRSRDQLEIILGGVADGITAQDTSGRLVYANQTALRTLGFKSMEEMRAQPQGAELKQFDILDDDGNPFPLDRLPARMALQGKESPDTLIRWRIIATGEEHWSIVKATAVRDDTGRPYMAISIFRDITEQRLAEQERERLFAEIAQQRERLDNVVANVPGVVWEAWGSPDEAGQRVDYVSEYAEKMLGYSTEEWLSTPNFWLTIVHPDDREKAARVAGEQFASGEGGINRFRWVAKDGRVIWAEANATVIKDRQGNPLGMRGVTMDLSDRKRLEDQVREQAETLRTEYERLATAVASVDIGLTLYDTDGRIIIVNDQWLDQSGYRREEVIGHRIEEFSTSPEAPQSAAIVDRVLATGEPFQQREMFGRNARRPDGWYIDLSVLPLRDAGGAITGALSATVDVTGTVQARQQIEAQRATLETIVEGVPVGVALLDRNMRIVNLNARWARMTGVDLDTARGRILYEAAPSFEERRPAYERVMAGEPVHLTNVPYQVPGEDKVHYRDIYLRPVRDPTGAVTGMINAVIDVTERYTLDQQKDALIALASHELRTPITAIKGYTQLGLRAAGAGVSGMDERLARTLRIVNDKADLLTRLVNDMLDVSRIQSGTLPLEKESFDLGQLIKEITAGLALTQPDFIFALDLPPTPIEVNADRQRMEQVITNLVQNAVKYSGDSRRVEIKLILDFGFSILDLPAPPNPKSKIQNPKSGGPQDNQVTVSVRDFGIGIPASQQSQLFDRFFRASNVKSTQQSGLGLGLYIANDIVARHGGRMWCDSTEGQGSTFYFTLPLLVG